MSNFLSIFASLLILGSISCNNSASKTMSAQDSIEQKRKDSLENVKKAEEQERLRPRTAQDIELKKELSYDKYSLQDTYAYNKKTRSFQWDKIKEKLAYIENFQREQINYAVLQNYKNKNRESPVVEHYVRNAYKRVSDTLGTERYQSAPLYEAAEKDKPSIYGRDGSLVRLISSDTVDMVEVSGISFEGKWFVPKRYVKAIGDSLKINHVVFVDVTNQNICTIERTGEDSWTVKSMNPATTGRHLPPHAMETPTGIFMIQEKKSKMFYMKDGTSSIEGYAPYASRFTNGAYIHGVPVNNPSGKIIEYSASLGTTPRSHMCVRNASSHAKFVYDWSKTMNSLVIVID